eukprot:TRINITY_DN962_c0_g1_i1.p6 TRINITY_DN962_c0_g1~~TRINITY_DN962_c0_g1_i1.p6  ORF type:complete len:174 (-),score=20.70 TRINITY_DN962_c0_g1_i1:710-1231(-)
MLYIFFLTVGIFQAVAQNGWPEWPSWPSQSPSQWPAWPEWGESRTMTQSPPSEVEAEVAGLAISPGEEVIIEDSQDTPQNSEAVVQGQVSYEDPTTISYDTSESNCMDASICFLPMKTGSCRAFFALYYYEPEINDCIQFVYGGCDGNANRFQTYDDCIQCCQQSQMRKMHLM